MRVSSALKESAARISPFCNQLVLSIWTSKTQKKPCPRGIPSRFNILILPRDEEDYSLLTKRRTYQDPIFQINDEKAGVSSSLDCFKTLGTHSRARVTVFLLHQSYHPLLLSLRSWEKGCQWKKKGGGEIVLLKKIQILHKGLLAVATRLSLEGY